MNHNLFRAFKDNFLISKTDFITSVLKGVFEGINPMIAVLFSQYVLNALSARQSVEEILKIVFISLTLSFIFLVLGGMIDFFHKYSGAFRVKKIELLRNNKMIDVDYSHVEDPEVVALRRQVSVYGFSTAYSFENLTSSVYMISKSVTSILISLWILLPVFRMKTGSSLDSLVWIFVFIAYVFISFLIPYLFEKKQEGKMLKAEEDGYKDNLFINYLVNLLNDPEVGKEIRIYKQQNYFINKIKESIKGGSKVVQIWVDKEMKSALISKLITQIGSFALTIFVILKIVYGDLGAGYVVSSVAALNSLLVSLPLIFIIISTLLANPTAIDAHYRYMDLKNQSESGSLPIEKRLDNDFELEVKDLNFTFPNSDYPVLEDISIKFENGKSYAIVGENGSGKTTFIKLLTRLYSPTSGEISLNEIDISKYEAEEYYSLFNVVFQDFSLFSFTLGETIATNKNYDHPRVESIIDEIGLKARYEKMPYGLDSIISKTYDPDGIGLSGGEKQKLAIARAIYKDGPIYILDEPTSALDPVSEYEVYEQFNRITEDKTSIFISHRLSSCRFCDEILVFDKGKIVQKGRHDDLVSLDGKYSELWHAQAQYYI